MQYVTNIKGKKTGVLISMEEYKEFLSVKEEIEDIKDFDRIIADNEWVDGEKAKKELGL